MKNYTIILFLFLKLNGKAQSFSNFIKQNAIELKSELIFDKIKAYKCLMIGEMHGTKEPAEFLTDLVRLSSKNGKKIILGLEIPANDMVEFIKKKTTKNLKKTIFFKNGYGDGRNNEAWFELIENCKKLKNVEFCFFDMNSNENSGSSNRDSIMFNNLIKAYKNDTTKVIYTLSGNIHNKIKPYRNNKTLGCYMVEYLSENTVLTINHFYGEGTMFNRTPEGLKIRKIKGQAEIFNSSTKFENYFLPKLPEGFMDDYTALFYTKTMTASIPIDYKGNHPLSINH